MILVLFCSLVFEIASESTLIYHEKQCKNSMNKHINWFLRKAEIARLLNKNLTSEPSHCSPESRFMYIHMRASTLGLLHWVHFGYHFDFLPQT